MTPFSRPMQQVGNIGMFPSQVRPGILSAMQRPPLQMPANSATSAGSTPVPGAARAPISQTQSPVPGAPTIYRTATGQLVRPSKIGIGSSIGVPEVDDGRHILTRKKLDELVAQGLGPDERLDPDVKDVHTHIYIYIVHYANTTNDRCF